MKRLLYIVALLLFVSINLFANTPSSQNADIKKYTNLWQNFLSQYVDFLENYESTHPKAQALEKKVQLSYTTMRDAYSLQYSRCVKFYNKQIESGVKKGAPMVKDLELEIENLRIIGGKMKKTMTIDQQKELAKWFKDNELPQKLDEIRLAVKSAEKSAPSDKPSSETRKPGERLVKVINGVEFAFRWCPPGTFMMGSPISEEGRQDDETQHQVTLTKGFWIMETEVSQKQWKAVMGSVHSYVKGEDLPVGNVSYGFCQEFCKKCAQLGLPVQLPTEAQWEYACRAGTTDAYAGSLNEMAWYINNSNGNIYPVGTKKPNAWGLYDMHGNLYERCQDWYGEYPSGSVTDPVGPSSGKSRVIRGGDYWSDKSCRSAYRYSVVHPDDCANNWSFRCVLSGDNLPKSSKIESSGSTDENKESIKQNNNVVVRKAGKREVFFVNGVEFAFRWCPPGTFIMGSPRTEAGRKDDETQHRVTLTKGFWIMETEVSQKQWKAIMGSVNCYFKGLYFPVGNISFVDCEEFCQKCAQLGFPVQLPTEAQWEYACRAGRPEAYAGNLNEMAWYFNNSGGTIHSVGTKRPNAWGLYDMHGNLYERCQDWYDEYPGGSVTDPVGPSNGYRRVIRGGDWTHSDHCCRSASRESASPTDSADDYSFRCILPGDIDPKSLRLNLMHPR